VFSSCHISKSELQKATFLFFVFLTHPPHEAEAINSYLLELISKVSYFFLLCGWLINRWGEGKREWLRVREKGKVSWMNPGSQKGWAASWTWRGGQAAMGHQESWRQPYVLVLKTRLFCSDSNTSVISQLCMLTLAENKAHGAICYLNQLLLVDWTSRWVMSGFLLLVQLSCY
jgi:hypothetical protein